MDFEWLSEEPEFKSGDKVYVINKHYGSIHETVVRTVPVEILFDKDNEGGGTNYLKFSGFYKVGIIRWEREKYINPTWHEARYFFASKEKAIEMGRFWPVKLSDEEWLDCIGDRQIIDGPGNTSDGCELTACCAAISDIRDALIEIKFDKGVCEVDRLILKGLLEDHEHIETVGFGAASPKSQTPILSKLLGMLELTWNSTNVKN